ncbi:TusE/DsrC/DsvC family sulfur relay protein [Buchnera aphidicola]|uniref:Sulfurtransferase n=1 Tax=Buchnera aphidicola (Aphis gossypii) TaxID=98785 RepID=A0A5J6ZDV1_9GAMM|nr:TusE/DsrC/DsvC family sulfur relay protein [Buchnera aphidicola]QFQ32273.1 TusE/DsrC/DsvC family sulfur relay protein [Buchnera aphidicola (Aphis gossypii)]UPT14797.1 TusE/DsrC/DsvC family sulfur relay protein [Buchnera aphidicola (Aphis gossypii)]
MLLIKSTKNHLNYETVEKDLEGYLKNNQDWNIYLAEEIAKKEKIKLTDNHWEIIYFIRKFYFQYNITPSMRMLIHGVKKESDKKINSIYLFKLFPKGPAKQASKIAGIPKPSKCL